MKKFYIMIAYMFFIVLITFFIIRYSYNKNNLTVENIIIKNKFTEITGFSDLSFVNEADYIRHGSVSYINSVFFAGPDTGEIFSSGFMFQPSKSLSITNCDIKK